MKSALLMLLLSVSVMLADTPVFLESAVAKMAADSVYQYSYTKIEDNRDTQKVIKYDASQEGDDCWTLVSVNDRKPTKEEYENFYESISYSDGKGSHSMGIDFDRIYNITKLSESDELINYQFKSRGETKREKKMQQNMRNIVSINKADTAVVSMTMELTQPVSPMISVKMKEMSVEMKFKKMPDTGAYKIKKTTMNMAGSFAIFKKFDKQMVTKYYDYQLVP